MCWMFQASSSLSSVFLRKDVASGVLNASLVPVMIMTAIHALFVSGLVVLLLVH